MIVGNYGSGKTEVAVHMAAATAARGVPVSIVDLDLVNPYFRCREARAWMEARGVKVVVPPPRLEWADLPIMLPEVPALLHPPPGAHAIFDVGGDDVGARALASLHCSLGAAPYELWQVVNARRPFTDTVGGCLKMLEAIEHASRLKVTGLVANTHLMQDTTAAIVREGYELARDVALQSGLPLRCVTAPAGLELADIDAPLLRLGRIMLPPWAKGETLGSHRD
jgi:hypothetical protein